MAKRAMKAMSLANLAHFDLAHPKLGVGNKTQS